MRTTRREFLSQAAVSAALAGFSPGVVSLLAGQQKAARPYLEVAIRCAEWIDRCGQERSDGLAWPANPLQPDRISLDFYNGTPGVVSFFANLWHATANDRWRDRAVRGGAYLIAEASRIGPGLNAGLYTGLAGLGTTYLMLDVTKSGSGFGDSARQVASLLKSRSKSVDDGVEWSESYDIVSGSAGTGLFLLQAARVWSDRSLLELAVKAGRRLLKAGQPAEGGLMWFPGAGQTRNYPNFSHGTAGVAYFLASLHAASREPLFLDGAIAGAKYLDAVSTQRNGARAVFHVTGGGESRFYLSWCHGPVGTARLFDRLFLITGDQRWSRWVYELTAWLVESGAPERQSDGYWNNISQCCGNVGIGQYWIDLERHFKPPPDVSMQALRQRVVENTLSRGTEDGQGLKWVQAENRVQPEILVAQTGFMQGAAGVGTFFLQLDAFTRQQPWPTPMPDTPWA